MTGRGNQYIKLVQVWYCKLPTIGKQPQTYPRKVRGLNHQPQRWEVSMLPLRHRGSFVSCRYGLHSLLSSVLIDLKENLFHFKTN